MGETKLVFQINAGYFVVGLVTILLSLFAIIWRGKSEISKTIKDELNPLQTSLEALRSSLATHGEDITGLKVHTKYGISNSPTVPNDLGKKILRDSGFDAVYPKIKNKLFTLMDTMSLRTLYDYEKGAVEALRKLQSDPDFDPLKNHAVSNPDYPLELIYMVASWVIRDEYAEHKGSGKA